MSTPRTTTERVAAEVRAQMARKRVTQTDLAAALGVSQMTISRRLNGRAPFDVEELAAVALALDVPLATLVTEPTAAAS